MRTGLVGQPAVLGAVRMRVARCQQGGSRSQRHGAHGRDGEASARALRRLRAWLRAWICARELAGVWKWCCDVMGPFLLESGALRVRYLVPSVLRARGCCKGRWITRTRGRQPMKKATGPGRGGWCGTGNSCPSQA